MPRHHRRRIYFHERIYKALHDLLNGLTCPTSGGGGVGVLRARVYSADARRSERNKVVEVGANWKIEKVEFVSAIPQLSGILNDSLLFICLI